MRFGLILDGGTQPGWPRDAAFKELLARATLAHRWGFHSLWTGPGYLNQGWHPTVLLARIAAEVPGVELGVVSLLPLASPGGIGGAALHARCHLRWPGRAGGSAGVARVPISGF